MKVWVCESGDYEQRSVNFVCASIEAGIDKLKRTYGPPYLVKWDQPEYWSAGATIVGHFQEVPNYCARHSCEFGFIEYLLVTDGEDVSA